MDGSGETEGRRDGENALCKDHAEPVDFGGAAETPEEHGKGDGDERGEEEPEDVFWFCDASITASQAHHKLWSCEGYPERAVRS